MSGGTGFYSASGGRRGIRSWIFSTDHKRIGILYLFSIFSFFAIGVTFGLLMRLELIAPGKTIVEASTYNAFFTLHGVIMIFLFIIPGIPVSLGNFFLPLQIGSRDVAFPRINLLSWWFYITGWHFYLSLQATDRLTQDGPSMSPTASRQGLTLPWLFPQPSFSGCPPF